MKHPSKKYKISPESTSRDRLSELPDNVIVHILSFLPLSDAVKTVLLRRFGNLWTMVPSLHICSWHTTLPFFLNFVRNVVVFHRYPTIDEFHLETHQDVPEIEMWTRFALNKEAKVLKVDFHNKNLCTLPHCVFFNQSLVSLEIRRCYIEQQSRLHMASLRKLVLEDVCFSDDKMLEQIVSGCPSLEELAIFSHFTYLSLCISSTNIKLLKLLGYLKGTIDCPYLRTLHIQIKHLELFELQIIDVSSLNEVEIDVIGLSSKHHSPPLLSLLKKVGNAELVKLTGYTLDVSWNQPPKGQDWYILISHGLKMWDSLWGLLSFDIATLLFD